MASGRPAAADWAARTLDALAAHPASTTVSQPTPRRSVWAAALAGRPITTAARAPQTSPSEKPVEADQQHAVILLQQVRRVLADTLAVDAEHVSFGTGVDIKTTEDGPPVHVRVTERPMRVEVRYPVLAGIAESEALHARLSRLNAVRPDALYTYVDGMIWASQQVPGVDFQPVHLQLAIEQVTRAAPVAAADLHPEFGGVLPHASRLGRTATAMPSRPGSGARLRRRKPWSLYKQMGIEITEQWFIVNGFHYSVAELSNLRTARGPHHPATTSAATVSGVGLLATAAALGLVGGAALYPWAFLAFSGALVTPAIAMAVGGRLRPRSWELWADYYSITIRLFLTDSERQYAQVTRALLRAKEIARLRSAAEPHSLEAQRRTAVRR